jgi:GT2 family glycosyltransferase
MPESQVAVVILNWNGQNYLEQFLPSVIKHSGNARIVVADNASTDDSVAFVQANYPQIEIIVNDENGGFAKGYNDAFKKVDAEYYLLLNSDIEVTENWIAPLVEQMKDPQVAGCQPKVKAFHNKHSFEHAGASGGYLDRNYFPFCRGRIFLSVESDQGQYDGETEVFWASGACLLIRSELFHKAGGFDEEFFAHMEEIDLCWRLKKMNYKFMVCPQSTVFHIGGGTLPYTSPRKVYLNFRNSLLMIVKNHEGILLPKIFIRLCIDGIAASRFLMIGEFKQFSAVFRAHNYMFKNLSSLLKKRKEIKRMSTTFNSAGLYNGNILGEYFLKGVKEFSKLNQRLFK